jgi:hypothetical protein
MARTQGKSRPISLLHLSTDRRDDSVHMSLVNLHPFLSRLVLAMLLAGSAGSANAKVSVSAMLCFAQKRLTIDLESSAVLTDLTTRARELERIYGKPDTVVVATILVDQEAEAAGDSEARAWSILTHLRGAGLAYEEHGFMRTTGTDPAANGCTADDTAVEVEILFAHQPDASAVEKRPKPSAENSR